jgi:hypothetical protein
VSTHCTHVRQLRLLWPNPHRTAPQPPQPIPTASAAGASAVASLSYLRSTHTHTHTHAHHTLITRTPTRAHMRMLEPQRKHPRHHSACLARRPKRSAERVPKASANVHQTGPEGQPASGRHLDGRAHARLCACRRARGLGLQLRVPAPLARIGRIKPTPSAAVPINLRDTIPTRPSPMPLAHTNTRVRGVPQSLCASKCGAMARSRTR